MRVITYSRKGIDLRNLLKEKLRRNEVTFGVTVGLGSSEVTEALANLGLDWIAVDLQHTSLDTEKLEVMLQAMSYSQCTPVVRVVSNDLGLINRALDMGAHATIIPIVNTREDAEKAVQASLYAPKGIRSWAPRRPALRDPDYAATADAQVMAIPQIETELSLRNLEDIVTTDGIEAVFVGPYDLSMSLGIFRRFEDPKYLKAVEKVVSSCEAHDVAPGLLAPTGPVEGMIQQGFKLISLGGDLGMLIQTVAETLRNAKNIAGKSAAGT